MSLLGQTGLLAVKYRSPTTVRAVAKMLSLCVNIQAAKP